MSGPNEMGSKPITGLDRAVFWVGAAQHLHQRHEVHPGQRLLDGAGGGAFQSWGLSHGPVGVGTPTGDPCAFMGLPKMASVLLVASLFNPQKGVPDLTHPYV